MLPDALLFPNSVRDSATHASRTFTRLCFVRPYRRRLSIEIMMYRGQTEGEPALRLHDELWEAAIARARGRLVQVVFATCDVTSGSGGGDVIPG